MKQKVRAAVYARAATAAVDAEPQLAALRAYVRRRDWVSVVEVLDVVSGPCLWPNRQRIVDAPADSFEVVLTWRLDRIAKSLPDLVDLLRVFDGKGWEFETIQDRVTTLIEDREQVFSLFQAAADFERDRVSERIILGHRAAGNCGGRPVDRPGPLIELKVLADYHVNRSLRKTAILNGISRDLVRRIVHARNPAGVSL